MKQNFKDIKRKIKKIDYFDYLTDKELFLLLKQYPEFFLCLKKPSDKIQKKYVSLLTEYYVKNFDIIDNIIIPNITSVEALIKLSNNLEKLKMDIIQKNKYKPKKARYYGIFQFFIEMRINTSIEKIKENKNYNNTAKFVLELINNEIN